MAEDQLVNGIARLEHGDEVCEVRRTASGRLVVVWPPRPMSDSGGGQKLKEGHDSHSNQATTRAREATRLTPAPQTD
jgi:hypothetical protein